MKKLTLSLASILLAGSMASAQTLWDTMQEQNLFNKVSAGVSLGVFDGMGLYVAAPIGDYVQVRAGFSTYLLGYIGVDKSVSVPSAKDIADGTDLNKKDIKFEGKFTFPNANLLFDVFPFKKSSFRVTAGAFIGSSQLFAVRNQASTPLQDDYKTLGLELVRGDGANDRYFVKADANGVIEAAVKTSNAFKPYLGIGFGRAVSEHRVNVTFDLGAMYCGGLGVYADGTPMVGSSQNIRLESRDTGHKSGKPTEFNDEGWVDKIYDRTKFYPVLRVSLFVRLF